VASTGSDQSSFVDLDVPGWAWLALLAFLGTLLVVDILVVHRESHEVHTRQAVIESSVWIAIGLAFTAGSLWLSVERRRASTSVDT